MLARSAVGVLPNQRAKAGSPAAPQGGPQWWPRGRTRSRQGVCGLALKRERGAQKRSAQRRAVKDAHQQGAGRKSTQASELKTT